MNFLKKLIKWELENILNEKQWKFFLMDGYEGFSEKINNRVALINKDKFEYNSGIKSDEKDFYGCINDNVLVIRLAKEQPSLSYINPTYFYFRGKFYAKENIIKGSFRRSNFFRLTSLFLLNAYFLHIIAYILYLIFGYIFYNRLEINYSIFFFATFGVVFLMSFIAIESSILRFFQRTKKSRYTNYYLTRPVDENPA